MKKPSLLLLLLPFMLSACNFNKSPYARYEHKDLIKQYLKEEVENDSSINFKKKDMNAFVYTNKSVNKIEVMFREDKLTKMPHISFKLFYKTLLNKDLKIDKQSDGKYLVTSGNGETALIDTVNDTLESDHYENFINTTQYRQEGVYNTYFDGAPFVKVIKTEFDKEAKKTAINFRKYHINLVGTNDDIILPLVTASNMFMGPTMLTTFYDQEYIYFIDPNDPKFETSSVIRSGTHIESNLSYFRNGRPIDECIFSYGELCFLIDNYYGVPGRETLHDTFIQTRDLDYALSKHDKLTNLTRSLLLSPKLEEYCAGLDLLQDYIGDAGHTVANYGSSYMKYYEVTLASKVSAIFGHINYHLGTNGSKSNASNAYLNALYSKRSTLGIQDLHTRVQGDTVMYTFDAFDFDIYEWNDFYAGVRVMPQDTIGNFVRALHRYEDNPNIKNFVLDISYNGGGYADLVFTIMSLMCNQAYYYYYDVISDNHPTTYYAIDRNFDGVFDEKDDEVNFHYNFAILSSAYSFSCGNMLPAEAKENGIMLLGDKTGGGACAVLDCISAEGLYVRLSSQDHILMKDGTEIDFGVPCDVTLVKEGNDFSDFFNLEVISNAMNEFYK